MEVTCLVRALCLLSSSLPSPTTYFCLNLSQSMRSFFYITFVKTCEQTYNHDFFSYVAALLSYGHRLAPRHFGFWPWMLKQIWTKKLLFTNLDFLHTSSKFANIQTNVFFFRRLPSGLIQASPRPSYRNSHPLIERLSHEVVDPFIYVCKGASSSRHCCLCRDGAKVLLTRRNNKHGHNVCIVLYTYRRDG